MAEASKALAFPNFYGNQLYASGSTISPRLLSEEERAELEAENKAREEKYQRQESFRQEFELIVSVVKLGKSVAEGEQAVKDLSEWVQRRAKELEIAV